MNFFWHCAPLNYSLWPSWSICFDNPKSHPRTHDNNQKWCVDLQQKESHLSFEEKMQKSHRVISKSRFNQPQGYVISDAFLIFFYVKLSCWVYIHRDSTWLFPLIQYIPESVDIYYLSTHVYQLLLLGKKRKSVHYWSTYMEVESLHRKNLLWR